MHMKTQNNPLKTSDTELQCIFPVLQHHPEKVLWREDSYTFTDTDIIFRNCYTETFECRVILCTLKFRVLSYHLDSSLTD